MNKFQEILKLKFGEFFCMRLLFLYVEGVQENLVALCPRQLTFSAVLDTCVLFYSRKFSSA